MKEYIFGKRSFEECLNSGYSFSDVLIADNLKEIEHFQDICVEKYIKYKIVKKSELDRITGTVKNNGIAFRIQQIKYKQIDEILEFSAKKAEKPFIVILDCIEDPRNFGAIIRTAEAAGVHGIIFPEDRAADITPYVIRTSSGAFFHQRFCRVKNIARTIEYLKKKNIWVIGLSENADKIYYDEDFTIPAAFVVGSEEKGIRPLVKQKCDFLVKIPMLGKVSSLNASVSTSVVFYEVIRQRSK